MGELKYCSAHYKFGHYVVVGGQVHIPASIISRKTVLLPFHRKLGGHHSRYRRSFEEIKTTACPENRNSIF